MDAPAISTLHQDESPSPQIKHALSASRSAPVPVTAPQPPPRALADEEDEDEDVDELVDELEDDASAPAAPPVPAGAAPPFTTAPLKGRKDRAPRDKPEKSRKRKAESEHPLTAPPMATFESIFPATAPDPPGTIIEVDPSAPQPKKKRATPRKNGAAAPARPRKSAPPIAKTETATPLPFMDVELGEMSDGYSGTAASSPPPDFPDRDHENFASRLELTPSNGAPMPVYPLLSNSFPVYPLPTKPFPVQPPPKIGTGFAQVAPFDKSGKRVRHWRQVNREVRGIAGGRWFARGWVGEKQSAFASAGPGAASANARHAQAMADANMTALSAVSLPKLASISMSAGMSNSAKGSRSKGVSRAGSSAPSSDAHASAARTLTKMRTSVIAANESPVTEIGSISASLR